MKLSQHNIFGPIQDSQDWFIINLLSGQADILNAETGMALSDGKVLHENEFAQKGYLVDPEAEKKRYRSRYLDFVESRDEDEVQVFFVPWYACNFSCSYCFQEDYDWENLPLRDKVTDAFFDFLNTHLADRRKYVTIFGGEPLLPGKAARRHLEYFVNKAAQSDLGIAIVTNGWMLEEYMDLLSKAKIREIQITLDGPPEVHDQRRPLKGGGSSFEKIARGVDLCLEKGLPVNLRVVVDRGNMSALPELAQVAIERGWTKSPFFKTQMGRNYELHGCQPNRERLYDRVEFHQALFELIPKHPELLEFHRPAFSIARFLFDSGETPFPLFDSCTGATTEWALDYQGRVFACTATVGKVGEELGTFWPELKMNEEAIEEWEERDVLSMEKCRSCELALACGGGCAAVAKNRTGSISQPDCRPVKKILEMGMQVYFQNKQED